MKPSQVVRVPLVQRHPQQRAQLRLQRERKVVKQVVVRSERRTQPLLNRVASKLARIVLKVRAKNQP